LLEFQEDHIICSYCNKNWLIIDGIPSFGDSKFYWSHIQKEKMEELINIAKVRGYKYALDNILLKETNSYVYYLACEESRADFSVLLDLDVNSKVLDIGCSWGAISIGLAKRCGELYAVDPVIDSLRFLKLRAEHESLSNIHLAKIDPLDYAKLPFPENFFDVVILNGVLEWLGSARTDMSVNDIRKIALQEIKRILKPNGKLYIGIENRYSLLYFLGAVDHHGLPFTSILPRFLSDRLMWFIKKRGYRTYTYSFKGYKNFLTASGFGNILIYMPLPTYHKLFYLIPLDSPLPLKYFWKTIYKKNDSPSFKRRIIFELASRLRFIWIYRMFAPSFSIISEKNK